MWESKGSEGEAAFVPTQAFRSPPYRTFASTMLLSLGVHPKVVQEILGHSQISMTMDIYSLVLPTMQQEAMRKLNDPLRG